jgi:hypothetical protein
MKVSFLELTDLLGPEEPKFSDDKSKKPMALMVQDGKGGVFNLLGAWRKRWFLQLLRSTGYWRKALQKGKQQKPSASKAAVHTIFSQ